MGPGVPIPVKSNSWVVVLLHGVGLWQIQVLSQNSQGVRMNGLMT